MTHWLMAAPSVVYKGRLSSIPKYIVLTGGRGVPCQEQQDCKWQTKKMQGSQAGNFRTHLKTHIKTQNPKLLHFLVSRLFILRSCIEFVNNLVTVASEMLTVTINFSKIQQCCSQSTEGSHRVPNPQFLLNIVQKGRGAGQAHVKKNCCKFCIILRAFWQHKFDITFFCRNIIIFGLGY